AFHSHGPYGTLHRVAVAAAYRGRGLAREMMQLGEDLALGSGCTALRCDTHPLNKPMQALLASCGYTLRGAIRLTDTVERDPVRLVYEKVF
ncbi:MAG: GNAT family N-acetyltransferase, partial [Oscillospiraceae bacterium]|nr:GNAT family N-acetyltransferase [Oscillospiraceae bacterium]